MAVEFTESEVPDTIPADIVRTHRRAAKRTVTSHHRLVRTACWEARLGAAVLVVAVLAGLSAAVLMAATLPPVRIPFLVLGTFITMTAVAGCVRRRRG